MTWALQRSFSKRTFRYISLFWCVPSRYKLASYHVASNVFVQPSTLPSRFVFWSSLVPECFFFFRWLLNHCSTNLTNAASLRICGGFLWWSTDDDSSGVHSYRCPSGSFHSGPPGSLVALVEGMRNTWASFAWRRDPRTAALCQCGGVQPGCLCRSWQAVLEKNLLQIH